MKKEIPAHVEHFPFNVESVLWWHWKCKIVVHEGKWNRYVSNSSVVLVLEFSLLVLGMTVQDLFLLAVGMGELVELVP